MNKLEKIFRSFLFCLAFLIAWISSPAHCNHQKEEKIYINPEQIEITDQAILVWSLDGKPLVLAKSLGFDDQGLYIKQLVRGPCGIHNRWCKVCGGCGVLLCPMNCTCYD